MQVWELPLTIDARDLLRWAASELEMAADIRELIGSIQGDTKALFVTEDQFAPLLDIGVAAENSRTHHAIASRLYKEGVKRAWRGKPVDWKPKVATKKQKALGFE